MIACAASRKLVSGSRRRRRSRTEPMSALLMLIRRLAAVAVALALVDPSWAQAPSVPAAKPPAAAKKSSGKKPAAKPAAAVDSGPCDMGVITATHDLFTVQKIGLTVFNNEFAEMPVSWGLDDLIYARVKAAGGAGVRRIT